MTRPRRCQWKCARPDARRTARRARHSVSFGDYWCDRVASVMCGNVTATDNSAKPHTDMCVVPQNGELTLPTPLAAARIRSNTTPTTVWPFVTCMYSYSPSATTPQDTDAESHTPPQPRGSRRTARLNGIRTTIEADALQRVHSRKCQETLAHCGFIAIAHTRTIISHQSSRHSTFTRQESR